MARLTITEVAHLGYDPNGNVVLAPDMPALVEQALPIGAGSLSSVPFGSNTRYVMVNTDVACYLGWDANAIAGLHGVTAGETRFYGVHAGGFVSVIQGP